MKTSRITCVDDLRVLARKRLPRMFYDFVDSGSWSQQTYRANETAFHAIRLRQRVAMNIAHRSTAGAMLGMPVAMPVALSPTGGAGLLYADGEIHAARAAERFGVPYALSIGSQCSLEAVRANTNGPLWFQVSILKDRALLAGLVDRALAADCSALILTMDFHVAGQRHADIKNGLGIPPKLTPSYLFDLLSHPRWCMNMLRARQRGFGNFIGHVEGVSDVRSFGRWYARQPFDLELGWNAVAWLRERWPRKLILKGILDPEDARRAVDAGADAISVSNQGGRQMDGAPASIEALPYIADAVGDRLEVLIDGGIRSGQDVLKALALGAKGVLVGRAGLYGLAAMGGAGVTKALEIIHKELDHTMAFCGLTSLAQANADILWHAVTNGQTKPSSIDREAT
ncbi:alpha-hydroxy acid oxidase [Burkholderia ubonensis]|uniref:alpha-hydroxy acid oxidase n=1 Tax=Burkholderia ubonensis TaxID=101571 RepID=UPI002AB0CBE8|nr:alpha-hydroxy acid oxidase [Burkholderia ubonensis]